MTIDASKLSLIFTALEFAARKHRDQRRKDADASPYINHPIAVAHVLCETGVDDPDVLSAALLHDTIEDTETTETELREIFGDRIASIVLELTDDKSLPKEERKRLQIEHAHALSPKVQLVKWADKICNLRDIVDNPPARWSLERRREYFEWAKSVVTRMGSSNLKLKALFDQVYAQKP
jgi:GTP diphosphokinase / guanosine-3',5'-bis(diphosphate) 3'-diphosphatase